MHRSLLAASAVPAAVAGDVIAASVMAELANAGHLTVQFTFAYGSGGTTATYWLQTSLDGGASWIDIACVQFTTGSGKQIVNIDAGGYVTPGYVPGDGTLAVGSVVDGILGDRLRIKQTIVGTYADSTIAVDVVDKAGVGAQKHAPGQTTAALSTPVVEANLPAASALGDADSNPTTTRIGAHLMIWNGATWQRFPVINAGLDARNTGTFPAVSAVPALYNGASLDRMRGNIDATLLASAARTATPTKVDQTNYNGRSLIVVIDVTVVPGSAPSTVFTIQGKDGASGKYYTILASAAITGTGTTVLRVSPHYAAAVANLVAIDTVPRVFAIDAVHGNANSMTYSVGYSLGL